jgi:hypothetical protein
VSDTVCTPGHDRPGVFVSPMEGRTMRKLMFGLFVIATLIGGVAGCRSAGGGAGCGCGH